MISYVFSTSFSHTQIHNKSNATKVLPFVAEKNPDSLVPQITDQNKQPMAAAVKSETDLKETPIGVKWEWDDNKKCLSYKS